MRATKKPQKSHEKVTSTDVTSNKASDSRYAHQSPITVCRPATPTSVWWCEDVRDIIGLVQRKMQAYILVAVLLLSFTGALWYEGKQHIASERERERGRERERERERRERERREKKNTHKINEIKRKKERYKEEEQEKLRKRERERPCPPFCLVQGRNILDVVEASCGFLRS